MALSTFRARLQAFINDPNVKTFGFSDWLDVVARSKISKAFSSLVGRALAQASMAPLIIRMLGRSMFSNILRASSVFPFRPRPTIFRSRSAYESLFCFLDTRDVVVAAIERVVKGFRCENDGTGQSFSSEKEGAQQFSRRVVHRIDPGENACPLSVVKNKTKHETNSVLVILI